MNKPYREPKPSSQVEDRLPVSTYDKALWLLVEMSVSGNYSERDVEIAMRVVGDIFWETQKTVETHVRRAIRQLGG